MGVCCHRQGQTIIPDTVVAKALLYSDETPKEAQADYESRFPLVQQQILPRVDEEIEAPDLSNPSFHETFGLDVPLEAPYRLDFSTMPSNDQQKEGMFLQERRQVISSCSIVSVHQLTSPLSFRKETEEQSFESVDEEGMGATAPKREDV